MMKTKMKATSIPLAEALFHSSVPSVALNPARVHRVLDADPSIVKMILKVILSHRAYLALYLMKRRSKMQIM